MKLSPITIIYLALVAWYFWLGSHTEDKPAGHTAANQLAALPMAAPTPAPVRAPMPMPTTEQPDPPYWNRAAVVKDIRKIQSAIDRHEGMMDNTMLRNQYAPDRLTLQLKNNIIVFVEIMPDKQTLRVGNLSAGKVMQGPIDGGVPQNGARELDTMDTMGYPPSITGRELVEQVPIRSYGLGMSVLSYADIVHEVAKTLLPVP